MIGVFDPVTELALGIGLLGGITVLLVTVAFAGGNGRRFTRRLQEVSGRKGEVARAGATQQRSLTRRDSATPGIDRIFQLLPRREMLVERLARTGRTISVGQYMLVTIAVIAIVTVGILVFAKFSLMPSLGFGVALGVFIPFWLTGRMGKKRIARFVPCSPSQLI